MLCSWHTFDRTSGQLVIPEPLKSQFFCSPHTVYCSFIMPELAVLHPPGTVLPLPMMIPELLLLDSQLEKLEAFLGAVNSNDNSHLVTVPAGVNVLSDVLISSPVFTGDGEGGSGFAAAAAAGAAAAAAGVGGGDGFNYGVDPNLDPELALALRVSMEEERARQERAAKEAADKGEGAGGEQGETSAAGELILCRELSAGCFDKKRTRISSKMAFQSSTYICFWFRTLPGQKEMLFDFGCFSDELPGRAVQAENMPPSCQNTWCVSQGKWGPLRLGTTCCNSRLVSGLRNRGRIFFAPILHFTLLTFHLISLLVQHTERTKP